LGVSVGQFLLIGLILFAAGVVQGAVGFGSGLIAVGLISALIGVRPASIAFCLPAIALCAMMLWRLRGHLRFHRVAPVVIGLLVGVPVGVWFLAHADHRALEIALGALMALSVLYNLVPRWSRRRWHPVFVGIPCGLLSGMLSGAFSTGGPPLVAYLSTQQFDRLRFAASLQMLFLINTSVRAAELVRRGLFTTQTLWLGLAGVVAVPLGATLGLRLLKKIPDRQFRWVVLALLALLAVRYLLP